jgi:hypothetical protein
VNIVELQVEVLKLPERRRRFVGMLRKPDGQVTGWEVFGSLKALQEWAGLCQMGGVHADGSLPFHARMHEGELRAFRVELPQQAGKGAR